LCEGSVHVDSVDFGDGILDEFAQAVDVGNDEGDQSQQSNTYLRHKDKPCKYFKSCAIRHPFATYNRRKHNK